MTGFGTERPATGREAAGLREKANGENASHVPSNRARIHAVRFLSPRGFAAPPDVGAPQIR